MMVGRSLFLVALMMHDCFSVLSKRSRRRILHIFPTVAKPGSAQCTVEWSHTLTKEAPYVPRAERGTKMQNRAQNTLLRRQ
jgi:hypothetical protein